MRKIWLITLLVIMSTIAYGQRLIQPKMIEFDWKGILYKYEQSFELRLHENGWAVAFNKGDIKAYDRAKFYQLEIGSTKDERERRQSTNSVVNFFNRSRSFIYGKQNAMINVRFGVGQKKYLSEKARRKGVAVGFIYEIGPSLAIMKPYYLELQYNEVAEDNSPITVIRSERYTEANADKFLNTNGNDIFGASNYFKGFGDVFVKLGGQAKFATHFAFGAYDKMVRAFEAGVMIDVFPSKIPIMVETEDYQNKNVFFRLYLSIQFGWRNNS